MIFEMWERRRFKSKLFIAFCLLTFVTCIICLNFLCPGLICLSNSSTSTYNALNNELNYSEKSNLLKLDKENFIENIDLKTTYFDINHDVFVFLHMQKTGGTTFGRYMVEHTNLKNACRCHDNKKRCNCFDEHGHIWLVSRYSTGWVCGLHADWTELHECVPKFLAEKEVVKRNRRLLYITILRDPIQRYLSEWKHVQRGSTWLSAKLMCNHRRASLNEVHFCFQGEDWSNVEFEEFTNCQHNLAHNRQTRMLANLSLIDCYSRFPYSSQDEKIMLESAKNNLRDLNFFGLTEMQAETRLLFEKTFNLRFTKDFVQLEDTHASKTNLTSRQLARVLELNYLDVHLYNYAKVLFAERLASLKINSNKLVRTRLKKTVGGDRTVYKDSDYSYEEENKQEFLTKRI